MDKQLRKDIKHDRFVEEVGHTVHYLQDHKQLVRKYGGIIVAVVVLVGAVYGFFSWRTSQRRNELREAALVSDGFVGENAPPGVRHIYKTQAEKDAATLKAYSDVAVKESGTMEGQVARYLASVQLCDQGKVTECEAGMREVMNGSDASIASLGKLSIITLYQAQGKNSEAEVLARQLVEKPTPLVSKEQAQIALARSLIKSKPQDAKVLLETLQATDRPSVTRAAVGLLGEMMGIQAPNR